MRELTQGRLGADDWAEADYWREIDEGPDPEPAGLSDADCRGCRFIAGEPLPIRSGMYCGRPVCEPGGSWCSRHRGLVWRAARSAQARPVARGE